MRGKILVFGIFVLMLIGMGSATTTINIKTLPLHTVFVTPISTGGGFDALSSPMQGFSGKYGDVVFTFEEEELDLESTFYDLNILVKEGSTTVHSEKVLDGFIIGEETNLIISLPEGVEPLYENESVEEVVPLVIETKEKENLSSEENGSAEEVVVEEDPQEKVEENPKEKSKSKGGFFSNVFTLVDDHKSFFYPLYVMFVIFASVALMFFLFKKHIVRFTRNVKETVVDNKRNNVESIADVDELASAEKQLKRAQAKVKDLRDEKKERLVEAKKKLLEAEKEIMKLREVKADKEDKDVTSEEMKRRLREKD